MRGQSPPYTLGIDPGIATLGWAMSDRVGRVIDLNVSILHRDKTLGTYADMMRRVRAQSVVLHHVIGSCDRVQCESISWGVPGAIAKAYIAMSAAMVQALCVAHNKPLHYVTPQRWQHAVVPTRDEVAKGRDKKQRKLDADKRYREISDAIKAHIQRCRLAAHKLESIKTKDQNHAVDAAGLAVFGALNWEGC